LEEVDMLVDSHVGPHDILLWAQPDPTAAININPSVRNTLKSCDAIQGRRFAASIRT
jgi:hypothetical protein